MRKHIREIYQHSILKKEFAKILQSFILVSLTAVILLGCGQNEKQDFTMQLSVQSGIHFLWTTPNQIKSRIWGAYAEIKYRNMPEIEVSQSTIVIVKIHNAEEYRAFVGCLDEYTDYGVLWLELAETDTVIYLDEILAYHNFHILTIQSGGTIAVRNIENLNANPLRDIKLYHPYAIEENVLGQMSNLEYITICLNSCYTGILPAKELLYNTNCGNINMIWDDDRKEEVNLEEFTEWDEMNALLPENIRYLKAIFVLNEEDYDYISYEFCGEEAKQDCEAFICIKDRETHGEKYFDILEVPVENIRMYWLDVIPGRMRLMDMNFDGYRDLIFLGYNDAMGSYDWCIGFLWNENEQRYEWNATVPKHYRGIDDERKRITNVYTSALLDEYFIYEYHDGKFTEKKMEVIWSMTNHGQIIWQYYEDGKLMKKLEEKYDEDTKLYYITYEENGNVTEEVMEESDYNYQYDYSDLGKKYFPEFDFYWAG